MMWFTQSKTSAATNGLHALSALPLLALTLALGCIALASCSTSKPRESSPSIRETAQTNANNNYAAVKEVMMAKMVHANGVLSGITMADFRLIEQSANELAFLSRLAEWQVHDTPEYLAHSQQFRSSVEALGSAAADSDLEACESAYAQMTRSCLNCHAYLRHQGLLDMPVRVSSAAPQKNANR